MKLCASLEAVNGRVLLMSESAVPDSGKDGLFHQSVTSLLLTNLLLASVLIPQFLTLSSDT